MPNQAPGPNRPEDDEGIELSGADASSEDDLDETRPDMPAIDDDGPSSAGGSGGAEDLSDADYGDDADPFARFTQSEPGDAPVGGTESDTASATDEVALAGDDVGEEDPSDETRGPGDEPVGAGGVGRRRGGVADDVLGPEAVFGNPHVANPNADVKAPMLEEDAERARLISRRRSDVDRQLAEQDDDGLGLSAGDVDIIAGDDPEYGKHSVREQRSVGEIAKSSFTSPTGRMVLGLAALAIGLSAGLMAAFVREPWTFWTAGVVCPPSFVFCYLSWKNWLGESSYSARVLRSLGEDATHLEEMHRARQAAKLNKKLRQSGLSAEDLEEIERQRG